MLFNIELYHRDGEGQGYFVEETAHAPSAARPGRPTR
jgi:hypothetical protein